MSVCATQYLPSYTVGTEAYDAIPEVLGNAKIAVIGGKRALRAASGALSAAIEGTSTSITGTYWYGGQATYANVDRLCLEPGVRDADALFAVGGGKAVDACKIIAHRLCKPLYTLPTIASNCSPVSCISIMYNEDGSFKEIVHLDTPPAHCFINTHVIADAPQVYLWAGIGDTLAKYYEVSFSMRGDNPWYGSTLGHAISRMCNGPLLDCAQQAYEDCAHHIASAALEHAAMNIIVSTGLVSGMVGKDYNSALAHALFYGLTTIPSVEREHLHGEVVAYGVLVQLAMDGDEGELGKLLPFYRSLGLPTCLADLGLSLRDDFSKALAAAEANEELEHVPYPVTRDKIWKGIRVLEDKSRACNAPASSAPLIPAEEA